MSAIELITIIRNAFPNMPIEDVESVESTEYNGNVESTVRVYITANYTRYKNLRSAGYSRQEANEAVKAKVESIMVSWK